MRTEIVGKANIYKSLMLETLRISAKLVARLELLNRKYPSDNLREAIDRLRQSMGNAFLSEQAVYHELPSRERQ
jgi:hypothetical protein